MKTVVFGGTGTLGRAVVPRLTDRVYCFSRGELAQAQMRKEFPRVEYVIGDIRDRDAVRKALVGAQRAFLFAAIKHIDVAEKNPLEAVKTNFLGAVNVAEEAQAAGVDYVVFSNTDKAVLPISAYGYTKALAERYLLSQNRNIGTRFAVYNWGNVCGSRGSAIAGFVEALRDGREVEITDDRMSRFWIRIDDAASFMLDTYRTATLDKAMIPPIKAATVVRVIASLARLLDVKDYSLKTVGLRGIEKFHEVLESTHTKCLRSDTCEQYTDEELDDLLRPFACDAPVDSRRGQHGDPVPSRTALSGS